MKTGLLKDKKKKTNKHIHIKIHIKSSLTQEQVDKVLCKESNILVRLKKAPSFCDMHFEPGITLIVEYMFAEEG